MLAPSLCFFPFPLPHPPSQELKTLLNPVVIEWGLSILSVSEGSTSQSTPSAKSGQALNLKESPRLVRNLRNLRSLNLMICFYIRFSEKSVSKFLNKMEILLY